MQTFPIVPPFSKAHQLCHDLDSYDRDSDDAVTLPGYPSLSLNNLPRAHDYLERELWSQDLEAIAPHLWVMSTYSGANVVALHHQRIKGREILITEDPRLHLVWIHDRIFIKPLPRYLLSYAFWDTFLGGNYLRSGDRENKIRQAALGFLRTYSYLIRHESDFIIAQQDHLHLVPKDVQWAEFYNFVSEIKEIDDIAVSKRYCYGELRLSRLNLYAPLFLRRAYFEQVHGQYGDYFARLYGPILFVFAIFATLMNSMQVELAVEQVSSEHWAAFQSVSRWFSVIGLIVTALVAACFAILWVWMFSDEWIFAIRSRLRKRVRNQQMSKC